ncbi:YcnI family protein [Candidatus Mycobacterium wuenschmannii]|uniref:YcnI family protein n=1 Tax=Candidatus Mycobacterium wuenschmannii TaxID=3027808 RepID=A0ABY8VSI3_9MYCO|nr:YcnI family protein [Candidatus Mycobacterium wuenschmannii]WIM86595.1 YcnI family protein [Candidatus Mycobacterium wuenschmannii]
MPSPRRIIRRSLIGTAAAALLYAGPFAMLATASAHVQASSADATRGGYATVSFQVPNESTTGAPTTTVAIDLPDVSGVKIEAKPGWGARLDRDGDKVKSVTWTAAPDAGIPADQFDVFRIAVKLPDSDSVSFPTTQTYADGAVIKWDQPAAAGGAEPEHPVPTLKLNGGSTPKVAHHPEPTAAAAPPEASPSPQPRKVVDTTSRILAGAALLVGALGVGLALIVRRP